MKNVVWGLLASWVTVFFGGGCSQYDSRTNVVIETRMGEIEIMLSKHTPKHKFNFLQLAKAGVYDSAQFEYAVANGFLGGAKIQPKHFTNKNKLHIQPSIRAEFNPFTFHKKGSIGMYPKLEGLKDGQYLSDGIAFYITIGKQYNDEELNFFEKEISAKRFDKFKHIMFWEMPENADLKRRKSPHLPKDSLAVLQKLVDKRAEDIYYKKLYQVDFKFTPEQRRYYREVGGEPFSDYLQCPFGEVIKGLEVVQKLTETPVYSGTTQFKEGVRFKVKVIKED